MDFIINSNKTIAYFVNIIKKDLQNIKEDNIQKEKITKILENIKLNSLLPDINEEHLKLVSLLLNELNDNNIENEETLNNKKLKSNKKNKM